MIVAGQRLPILIATRPVDFRCGHQALALMVQTELKLDPHSGVTVIFRSKRGDRLKILVWDGSGMVLIYKILEHGSFGLAQGSGWDDASFQGAIRGFVRRS
jgi:transposase